MGYQHLFKNKLISVKVNPHINVHDFKYFRFIFIKKYEIPIWTGADTNAFLGETSLQLPRNWPQNESLHKCK